MFVGVWLTRTGPDQVRPPSVEVKRLMPGSSGPLGRTYSCCVTTYSAPVRGSTAMSGITLAERTAAPVSGSTIGTGSTLGVIAIGADQVRPWSVERITSTDPPASVPSLNMSTSVPWGRTTIWLSRVCADRRRVDRLGRRPGPAAVGRHGEIGRAREGAGRQVLDGPVPDDVREAGPGRVGGHRVLVVEDQLRVAVGGHVRVRVVDDRRRALQVYPPSVDLLT